MSDLSVSIERHTGLITLHRPTALNALTHAMILQLHEQLHAWEQDPCIHAIVIQATAGRAFCAGGDVRALYHARHNDPLFPVSFFRDEYRLNHLIHHLKKPYIALMDGLTFGGGVGISLHGSHPVASERFLFAMPETNLGLFPDIGASHLLSHTPHASGLYLGLTGYSLGPLDAHALGLIHAVIPADMFPSLLARLIDTDLSYAPHACVDACIRSLQANTPAHHTLPHAKEIDLHFSQQDLLNIVRSLSQSESDWAQETHQMLLHKSPLSLHITFAQLQRAKKMTLAECLQMDYLLTYHFMQHDDFYEGIRALLIDKDKQPHWMHASLDEVTPGEIATYFTKPPSNVPPLLF